MENKETIISNNFDIIDVAKSIAKEKGITAEEVLEAMETAIAKAGRTKYGFELDIRAHVNRDNGYIGLFRYQEVVTDLDSLPSEERINKVNIKDLPKDHKNLKAGVKMAKKYYETEASGNVNFKSVKKIAATGVDRISIGSITHSAPAIDFKLEI